MRTNAAATQVVEDTPGRPGDDLRAVAAAQAVLEAEADAARHRVVEDALGLARVVRIRGLL